MVKWREYAIDCGEECHCAIPWSTIKTGIPVKFAYNVIIGTHHISHTEIVHPLSHLFDVSTK